MKKTVFSWLLIGTIGLFAACNNTKKETVKAQDAQETATVSNGTTLTIDPVQSVLKWKGDKIAGGGHHGVISIKSGEVTLDGANLVGGKLVVDMSSINDQDLEGEMKGKLEGHLKSPDFFDVEKYPEAVFEITGAQATNDSIYAISGNLQIKDVTKNITLNAVVSSNNGTYTANVRAFSIDRTNWNIVYGTSKIADKAKDAILKNEIEFEATIVSKP